MAVACIAVEADAGRPGLLALLPRVLPAAGDALDLGTGTGRVALALAGEARSVIGVDIDAGALEAARWDAGRRGITNVRFVEADAETADLLALHDGAPFALVTARLFLSRRILERLPFLVAPGGTVLLEALEERHWAEAGGSRFSLPADEVAAALERTGLAIVEARVETSMRSFADARAAEAWLRERRFFPTWREDGRWAAWRARLRRGEHGLTEAHLVLWARRPMV